MSLLTDSYEEFVFMNKTIEADGYGGYITAWADGALFMAVARLDNSTEARVAEAQGVKALYTILTPKAMLLDFHDVVKRVSDGAIFRVTSDGQDNKTPKSATLNIRAVNAEKWELPT